MRTVAAHTVWLASYPRSGNTWTRAVLTRLAPPEQPGADERDLDLNALGGGPIAGSRSVLDPYLGFASSDLLPAEVDAVRPACEAAFDADLDRLRLRKAHDALRMTRGGPPVVPPHATRAAVYLVRDPRDVAVSWAHFTGRSMASVVAEMADPGAALADTDDRLLGQARQRLGTWSWHVTSWTADPPFPVTVSRYEDLRADPVGGFARMASSLGLAVDRERVVAAVAATRFDRLRALEAAHGFGERSSVPTPFFRRGAAGGWRDDLPARLARRIEEDHGAAMTRFGYIPG
jgi:aryl sulfotransferase